MPSNLESLLILSHIPHLGPKRIISLTQQFGSAKKVLEAPIAKIKKISIHLAPYLHIWEEIEEWKNDLRLVEKEGVTLLPYDDPLYPASLLKLPDYPPLLYVKGKIECLKGEMAAIVGTRAATRYGTEIATSLGKDVAQGGFIVVSGLARGIDTAAHEGALLQGKTIGVVGSGLANLYPRENRELAEKICERGAIISELPMFAPATKYSFPRRNRIVAALCQALVLVESPLKGGSMITMELGKKMGKPLFAIPGRVDDDNFKGNHALLKKGVAKLIETGCDLPFVEQAEEKKSKNLNNYSNEEKRVLTLMKGGEKSIEELVLLTQLPVMKLNILLMRLILKKTVKEFPGKIYKRII